MRKSGNLFLAGVMGLALTSAYGPVVSVNAAARDTGHITLTLDTEYTGVGVRPYQDLAKEYEHLHPNVTIKVNSIAYNDYGTKLAASFAAGKGPDLFEISDAELLKYVDSKIAYPVDKWLYKNKSDYYPSAIQMATVKGHAYVFPFAMDLIGLLYNKKLFQENHLSPPTTWDQTIADAKKLQTKHRYGIEVATQEGYYQNYEFYPWVWMNGGNIIQNDNQVVVNNATGKALGFFRQVIQSGLANKNLNGESSSDLADGKTAMMLGGTWLISDFAQNYPHFQYGFIPDPVPKAGMKSSTDGGGWKIMVSSRGPHPEIAADVANFMFNTDPARVVHWLSINSGFGVRKSVDKLAKQKGVLSGMWIPVLNKIAPNVQMEPRFIPGVVKAVGDAIQAAEFSNQPIASIVANLKQQCQQAENESR